MASSPSWGREEEIEEGRRVAIQAPEEHVIATGVSPDDEQFSLKAALVAMVVLTVIAAAGQLLGLNPFAGIFNASFVYVPTAILILVMTWSSVASRRQKERLR